MSLRQYPPLIRHIAQPLRSHLHVLIIVPLVVIAITWPTFPRIFDADEFWLHAVRNDMWLKLWDTWHFERVLAGQSDLYFTEMMYHPSGLPLAFHHFTFPHALPMIALKAMLPVDDAYNLLFLLMLCFNALCGYALIRHMTKDKWIGLFGAVVFAVATPFPKGETLPDLILIGTLPLTLYFLIRSLTERNWHFALLAGLSAGVAPFISMYIFAFTLLTLSIFVLFSIPARWKQATFWRDLLIFFIVCASLSFLRFYPMVIDRSHLTLAMNAYQGETRSNDALEYFVLPNNPITGQLFSYPLGSGDVLELSNLKKEYKDAYLGYINLLLIACAFLFLRRRGRLLPWLVILLFFAILRLGAYLTFNGFEYTDIALPEGFLRNSFPFLFQNIGIAEYYQIGVVTPLAVLASYGLAALLRSKPPKARMLVILFCTLVVSIEFTTPRLGQILDRQATAFVAWLHAEPEDQIRLVHLPLKGAPGPYYLYLQTLTGYPQINGNSSRLFGIVDRYLESNLLLKTWDNGRAVYCLKHNEESFTAALDQLLLDGFTHFVMHRWFYGDNATIQSFKDIPPAYEDGYVSVYRVRDMRLSCENQAAELPRFIHFAQSTSAAPGSRSAILSIHPHQAIDPDRFAYLDGLFSDWRSLLHLYLDDGDLVMQSAGKHYDAVDDFIKDNQVIQLLYNTRDARNELLNIQLNFDAFNLCLREANGDGAVHELYVTREIACELVTAAEPFIVQYDNGARLENLLFDIDQDQLDLQLQWSNLPDDAYSLSMQVFDAAGEKLLGQDSVIGHVTLARHQLDVSSLPPGDYRVKLIMYKYNSGAIVSGTVSGIGARFDRELLIANWHHN